MSSASATRSYFTPDKRARVQEASAALGAKTAVREILRVRCEENTERGRQRVQRTVQKGSMGKEECRTL
eukprot:745688-Hanusia_phi.AAC.2